MSNCVLIHFGDVLSAYLVEKRSKTIDDPTEQNLKHGMVDALWLNEHLSTSGSLVMRVKQTAEHGEWVIVGLYADPATMRGINIAGFVNNVYMKLDARRLIAECPNNSEVYCMLVCGGFVPNEEKNDRFLCYEKNTTTTTTTTTITELIGGRDGEAAEHPFQKIPLDILTKDIIPKVIVNNRFVAGVDLSNWVGRSVLFIPTGVITFPKFTYSSYSFTNEIPDVVIDMAKLTHLRIEAVPRSQINNLFAKVSHPYAFRQIVELYIQPLGHGVRSKVAVEHPVWEPRFWFESMRRMVAGAPVIQNENQHLMFPPMIRLNKLTIHGINASDGAGLSYAMNKNHFPKLKELFVLGSFRKGVFPSVYVDRLWNSSGTLTKLSLIGVGVNYDFLQVNSFDNLESLELQYVDGVDFLNCQEFPNVLDVRLVHLEGVLSWNAFDKTKFPQLETIFIRTQMLDNVGPRAHVDQTSNASTVILKNCTKSANRLFQIMAFPRLIALVLREDKSSISYNYKSDINVVVSTEEWISFPMLLYVVLGGTAKLTIKGQFLSEMPITVLSQGLLFSGVTIAKSLKNNELWQKSKIKLVSMFRNRSAGISDYIENVPEWVADKVSVVDQNEINQMLMDGILGALHAEVTLAVPMTSLTVLNITGKWLYSKIGTNKIIAKTLYSKLRDFIETSGGISGLFSIIPESYRIAMASLIPSRQRHFTPLQLEQVINFTEYQRVHLFIKPFKKYLLSKFTSIVTIFTKRNIDFLNLLKKNGTNSQKTLLELQEYFDGAWLSNDLRHWINKFFRTPSFIGDLEINADALDVDELTLYKLRIGHVSRALSLISTIGTIAMYVGFGYVKNLLSNYREERTIESRMNKKDNMLNLEPTWVVEE